MPKQSSLKKIRCLACGQLARSTVLGQCPRCMSVEAALGDGTDWTVDNALVRRVVRHDASRLTLFVRRDRKNTWSVHAVETLQQSISVKQQSICRVTERKSLPDAIGAAEAFARRWLEGAPGTSIATYVEKPTARARS